MSLAIQPILSQHCLGPQSRIHSSLVFCRGNVFFPFNCKRWIPQVWSAVPRVCCSSASASASAEDGDNGASPSPGTGKKGFGVKRKEKGDGKKAGGAKGLEQEGVLVGQGSKTGVAAAPERKGSKQLNKVVDIVNKKSTGRSSIDPAQARLGKVDFVRVQNWGEGTEAPKLEDLKVKSFSPAASSSQNKSDGPFYDKLVNRLQLLESKGDMAVAQAKPLPSFDRWAFGEDRYVQFLVDQRSVFEALRDGVGAIRKENCQSDSAGKLEEVLPLGGAACAVGLFDVDLGLDRCEVLSADITAITDSSTISREPRLGSVPGSTQAVGYAKYLKQLGRIGVGEGKKAKDACLKLLAHLFAVYVSHLTTGMRIGAKALDNVASLKQTRALRFYRDYGLGKKDPLQLFIATINSAGAFIMSEDDQEQVMEELAKAFQRTSLLLSVLAVEEQTVVAHE